MKYLLTILCFGILVSSGFAQTMKSLMYNTNGVVVYTNTNALTFTNEEMRLPSKVFFGTNDFSVYEADKFAIVYDANGLLSFALGTNVITFYKPTAWSSSSNRATTRTNLGLGWPALTNSNAATSLLGFDTNGQVVANIGTNVLTFTNIYGVQVDNLQIGDTNVRTDFYIEDDGLSISVYRTNTETFIGNIGFLDSVRLAVPITFNNTTNAATTRTNLGATAIGNAIFTASNSIAARQALGLQSYTNTLTNSINSIEIGSTVNDITIGWTIAPTDATYATRTLAGAGSTNTITNNSATLAFSNLSLTGNTTWTLTVGDGLGITNTATTSVNFLNYMSWGRSTNTTLNNAAIQTLHTTGGGASRAFATSRSRSFTMDGGGQYLYIAYPLSFGSATAGGVTHAMIVDGNVFNNFVVTTNTYTNASGHVASYLIYRTANIINGSGVAFTVQ